MLITNFSSGELSQTLFGRTDLEQYYRGAARLENFDVIPTGGIRKRPGTKKVLDGLEDGRIVPFILSRDEVYILHFTHEKITVYRAGEWDAPKKIFTNEDLNPQETPEPKEENDEEDTEQETLYKSDEIPFIQHAQNYRIMVLVHKNHRPFQTVFLILQMPLLDRYILQNFDFQSFSRLQDLFQKALCTTLLPPDKRRLYQ